MSIYGPGPLDNDAATEEFGAVLYIISDRIDDAINILEESSRPEQAVMALVAALRFLCEAQPGAANLFLERYRLERWQERYLAWLSRMDSHLPKEFKEGMRALAIEEFDRLLGFGGLAVDF